MLSLLLHRLSLITILPVTGAGALCKERSVRLSSACGPGLCLLPRTGAHPYAGSAEWQSNDS